MVTLRFGTLLLPFLALAACSGSTSDASSTTNGSNSQCGPDAPYANWDKETFLASCGGLQQADYPACDEYFEAGPMDWTSQQQAVCAKAGGTWSTARCPGSRPLICTGPEQVAACAVATNIIVQTPTPSQTPSDASAPPSSVPPVDPTAICPPGWEYLQEVFPTP